MITVLQSAGAVLTLLFGVLSLAVWRRLGPGRWERARGVWLPTTVCYLLLGVAGLVHAVLAIAAIKAGPGSRFMATYLVWSPAGNFARAAAVAVFALSLAVYLSVGDRMAPRVARHAGPVVLAAFAAGGAAVGGQMISSHQHWSVLAVLSTVGVVGFMTALLLGVTNDGLDQLLWLAIAAYAVKETLGVSLMAILAWWEVAPDRRAGLALTGINVAVMLVMVALAIQRLRLAARNEHVPALFERLHAVRRRPAES